MNTTYLFRDILHDRDKLDEPHLETENNDQGMMTQKSMIDKMTKVKLYE